MDDIFIVSSVLASPKRILLLEMLSQEPAGYTTIENWFKRIGVPAGSSEIYKHLKMLIEEGFVSGKKRRRWNNYVITKKGLFAIEKVKGIAKTEAKVPKISMSFE